MVIPKLCVLTYSNRENKSIIYLTIACTMSATTDPFKISGAIAKATAAPVAGTLHHATQLYTPCQTSYSLAPANQHEGR